MPTLEKVDSLAGASHRHMIAHLTGSFTGGALEDRLPISNTARLEASEFREALVVLAPLAPVDGDTLRVIAVLNPGPEQVVLAPVLEFARYTEAGSFLPVHAPKDPFVIELKVERVTETGTATPVPAANVTALLEARMIQGVLGRLLFVAAAEKARIRRLSREIAAMRLLSRARHDALDRMGAQVAVPRFADEIRYDGTRNEIVTTARPATDPEPDAEYANRLRIYHRWTIPNRATLMNALNGRGMPTDPNAGLLNPLGVTHRLGILEQDNEFAVAIQLVSTGDDQVRLNFLEHVRATRLIWPANSPQANLIHAARFIPSARQTEMAALRARLQQRFQFSAADAIAPALAVCLDRLGRSRGALGVSTLITVHRAQDSNGGSRFEMGLGVEIDLLAAAEINALVAALLAPDRAPANESEIEQILRSMTPVTATEDPDASWLFEACGLKTVHRLANGRLYLSNLPIFGLQIQGASRGDVGATLQFTAAYEAPGDPGGNAVLVDAVSAGGDRWTAGGGLAFTLLSRADAEARWGTLVLPAAPAASVFQDAGLRGITNIAAASASLKDLPPDMVATLRLDPAQAASILAGEPSAGDALGELIELFRDEGISAALPLVTNANEVLLALGVIGLPEVGTNLSARRSSGFRWYTIPLRGAAPSIQLLGSRTNFKSQEAGLAAVVALAYARRGLTDPYEYRVELPDGVNLNIKQYEYLMNMLDHLYPVGVEINTFSIRRAHVDLDGDGTAEPLPPRISRTYRKFQQIRMRGEAGVTLEPPE